MTDIFDDILRESLQHQVNQARNTGTRHAIMDLLSREGLALEFLPEWSDNEQAVVRAVENNGRAISFAHPSLQNDKVFILKIMSTNALAYPFLYPLLQNDTDVMKQAIQGNYHTLQYMSHHVRDNPYFMLDAILQHPRAYIYASTRIKKNLAIRIIAKECDIHHVDVPFPLRDYILKEEYHQAVDWVLTSWKA